MTTIHRDLIGAAAVSALFHSAIGDQGEIHFEPVKISDIPNFAQATPITTAGPVVISHSEQGNHHLLERTEGMQIFKGAPNPKYPAMDIFYAILENPTKLYQDATNPHGAFEIPPTAPGEVIEFTIAQEWDSFTQQARQVAD